MKIFIGCEEIGRALTGFAAGFRALGHEVTTLIKAKNKFYDYKYDYQLDLLGRVIDSSDLKTNIAKKAYKMASAVPRRIYERALLPKLIKEHDLFIFIWSSVLPDFSDISKIKNAGKKVITIFLGSDVRDPLAFLQEFGIDPSSWDQQYFKKFNKKIRWLRTNELFSDVIFSLPDQASLAIRPYYHVYIPFDPKEYDFNIPNNKVTKVIHAPSNKSVKGTDYILAAADRLKAEGYNFQLILLNGVPHHKVKQSLQDCDILIDQLFLHGPAMLALEAMASGCAVATRFFKEYKYICDPPICYVDENNIYDRFKYLLDNRDYVNKLASSGLEFIRGNYLPRVVAERMLAILNDQPYKFDYSPKFFLNKFVLTNNQKISEYNQKISVKVIEKFGVTEDIDLQRAVKNSLIDELPNKQPPIAPIND